MFNNQFKTYLKIGLIILITLLLLIPTNMIQSLIHERELKQEEVIRDVTSKWAGAQTINGPYLSIPYTKYVREAAAKDSASKIIAVTGILHVLPESLKINGNMSHEIRHRGIYNAVVYGSKLDLSGTFVLPNPDETGIPSSQLDLKHAKVNLGIDDLRGIEEQVSINWNQQQVAFNSGLTDQELTKSGIHANVNLEGQRIDSNYTFGIKLALKGSQNIRFVPVGKTTNVELASQWASPSFAGSFLPDQRTVSDKGFSAMWNIQHLNRNYPQWWTGNRYEVAGSAFGVDLYTPVDNYQKTYRSIHYSILFIAATFLVFFFIEVIRKIMIHPIQYFLVGIALVIFYILLLSLSEHIGFNPAFLVSALSTIALIVLYAKSILHSTALGSMLGGIITILYAFIFIIIQEEDYALLMGSIGIFMVLAITMFVSRKINWFEIHNVRKNKGPANELV
ncbi:MAG: cell envelope integrity protein CreD [Bacteroidia bacterium]